jgi:TolB-like protein/class 3 adenylate cyclase/Flp pilus assembly protein TadD
MADGRTEQRKLAAIMFTDMVGYSALVQRNESLALELLEEYRRVVRVLLSKNSGREVKTIGDGFLLEFSSALAAVEGGIEIQNTMRERNFVTPPERQVLIRIGIHVGDVVMSDGDIHGDGVNIAARIEPLASAGGICISSAVQEQVRNKLSRPMAALPPARLKNIDLPVVVYRVVMPWEEQSSSRPEETHPERGTRSQRLVTSAARRFGWVAALVLLAGGFGWWFVHKSSKETNPLANTAPTNDQKSIAVLPFANMSADKTDEYLSDGMTEELLNVLAEVKGLRVPGRSSSFAFKGKNEDDIFRKVGEKLHVNTVLEGSVRKSGNKLRVTAQLINVADGFQLWSQDYDGDMNDILAFQSDVAQRVVQALQVQLGVEEERALTKKPTENPEAYRLYLLGRHYWSKDTEAGWSDAIRFFNQAIQLDPGYAPAYCGLSDTYDWMGESAMSGREAWPKAIDMAQKALALNPDLADAHLSLGSALTSTFDWQRGESEIKRALELNRNLAYAYDNYAWLRLIFGRFDEAIANEKKAVELDPLSPLFNEDLAVWLYFARRYDEAIVQEHKTLELDPNLAKAHHFLGWIAIAKGNAIAAIAEFQKGKALDTQPSFDADLGYAYAISGDRSKAEQVLRNFEDQAKQRFVSPTLRAIVYLGLGEKDKALDWLEKSYEQQDGWCPFFNVSPVWDSLRNEPRFQALVKKVGLDK